MGEYIIQADMGDGAVMNVLNPQSLAGGGLEWQLRYGDPVAVRFLAATIVGDYDALTSREFDSAETIRRLCLLRKARRTAALFPGLAEAIADQWGAALMHA